MAHENYIEKIAQNDIAVVCMISAVKPDETPFYAYFMVPEKHWSQYQHDVAALSEYLKTDGVLLASGEGHRPDEDTHRNILQIVEHQLIQKDATA